MVPNEEKFEHADGQVPLTEEPKSPMGRTHQVKSIRYPVSMEESMGGDMAGQSETGDGRGSEAVLDHVLAPIGAAVEEEEVASKGSDPYQQEDIPTQREEEGPSAFSEGESENKDDQVKFISMRCMRLMRWTDVLLVLRGGLRWISLRPTRKIQTQATLMTSFPPNCSWYIACIFTQQSS